MKIINPAAGAAVMALGIFLYAAVDAFPLLGVRLGPALAIIFTIIAVYVYTALTRQFFQKGFLLPFLHNPVNSFVIGSWIAGMSVWCNVLMKYYPAAAPVIRTTALINTVFWVLFVGWSLYNFYRLVKQPGRHEVHGVILLSTVAAQSIVVVWSDLFSFIPETAAAVVIGTGLFFYGTGIALLVFRYAKEKEWTLTDDWTNTNCIIHGALSITGLALVSSGFLSAAWIMGFWVLVFVLLLLVEALEGVRAVQRVRRYGWKEGIFTYNTSQWSRNFTFGMFYAFSMTMHENPHYMNAMYDFHEAFLAVWAWIVLTALVGEITVFAASKWRVWRTVS
ncbi:hypothetical protein SAMN05518683_108153 [Salibacterium halotolerans]|uniref:Voltage-dependent anion channel n=2 Tax=Salibacterium halotolerans TaxID=1884432 RepID=A0A1I5SEL5_9BACI|nr:hypothetical protein SAMN05518683_108153 [Salibacterium halotolerans]